VDVPACCKSLLMAATVIFLALPVLPSQGQKTVTAEEFAPGVISTGKGFTVAFIPDGKTVYFTARELNSTAAKPPLHIYESHLQNGQWQPPKAVGFSSDHWSDLDPFVTDDGQKMFFVSTRPAPGKANAKPDMDIWCSEWKGGIWNEPQWIKEINSDAKEGSPSMDRNGNLYFFSDRGVEANQNSIYVTHAREDRFSVPERLPAPINAGPSDTSPWIASDGQTLLFYSTRLGGYGQADLYVSFLKSGAWSTPVNLGPAVNTEDFEYNPEVSRDGRTLYFGRGGRIYSIPLDALKVPGLTADRF
jgi:Tol biopolymer transport system component